MQIAILVPLRYPTEKAYGVNISYTAQALRDQGNEVEIFTFGNNSLDDGGNLVTGLQNRALRLARVVRDSKYFQISAFGFYLFQIIFSFVVSKQFEKSKVPDLVLTRSPVVAFFITRLFAMNKRVILELHHIPNRFERVLINKTTNSVVLVVTNIDFKSQLIQTGIRKVASIVPNASPNSFHEIGRKEHAYREPLNIGFAGKSTSSGYDNGLWISIELLEKCPDLVGRIRFTFIGCEESFHTKVNDSIDKGLINSKSVTLRGQLSHSELLEEIVHFDLALIPYPEGPYYDRSFPIKIVEMASAGIPMLVTDTKAHRRILGEPNSFFYLPGSYESLKESLVKILKDMELILVERERVLLFAKNYTYPNKAAKLLELSRS